jgi:hypothetical protein
MRFYAYMKANHSAALKALDDMCFGRIPPFEQCWRGYELDTECSQRARQRYRMTLRPEW